MRISNFFENTLEAPLRNKRWSWGGVDPSGRVVIRVWEHEIEPFPGGTRVLVLRDPPRRKTHGLAERKKHLRENEAGADGFAVVCKAADLSAPDGYKIASFDESSLLRLGELIREPGRVYALITDTIPIARFATGRMRASR